MMSRIVLVCMTLVSIALQVSNAFRIHQKRAYSSFKLFERAAGAKKSHHVKHKLVETQKDVISAVNDLMTYTEIGLDLEFDRDKYAYGFTLGLIQVVGRDGHTVYLFDPLSPGIDLQPLYKNVIENEKVTKIIHSPGEDIRLLQGIGVVPKNIFDTERCVKLLNFPRTSLNAITSELLGVELDKSEQTSNWIKRPLTSSQLSYAAIDVMYLSELKDKIVSRGRSINISHWLQEENAAWDAIIDQSNGGSLMNKKDRSTWRRSAYDMYIFEAILRFRDKYAKLFNKPAHQVIPKYMLLNLLDEHKDANQMSRLLQNERGVHPKIKRKSLTDELAKCMKTAIAEARAKDVSKVYVRPARETTEDLLKQSSSIQLSVNNITEFSALLVNEGNSNAGTYSPNTPLSTATATASSLEIESRMGVSAVSVTTHDDGSNTLHAADRSFLHDTVLGASAIDPAFYSIARVYYTLADRYGNNTASYLLPRALLTKLLMATAAKNAIARRAMTQTAKEATEVSAISASVPSASNPSPATPEAVPSLEQGVTMAQEGPFSMAEIEDDNLQQFKYRRTLLSELLSSTL
jgi:ribonuclease D